jgi:hypothetical protein
MAHQYPTEYLTQLHRQLDQLFSQEELMTTCFNMGIDYENLIGAGSPKSTLTRNLIAYLLRQDRLSDLVEECSRARPNIKWAESSSQSLGERNYLLISPDTPFNNAIWSELLNNREALNIGCVPDFKKDNKVAQYRRHIHAFIRDPQAKWLFTIWPEDHLSTWEHGEYLDILDKLTKGEKHIICFESGMTWKEFQKRGTESRPVFIIRTEYTNAAKTLITHAVDCFLKDCDNIHIVVIPGPVSSPAARDRRRIYNEFLAKLYHSQGLYPYSEDRPLCMRQGVPYWQDLLGALAKVKNLRTTYLEVAQWYRGEAKQLVASMCPSLRYGSQPYHTCFFCGNDDIALGARDAVRRYLGTEYRDAEFSYIGFDGIDEMVQELQAGMLGATMKVQFKEMCSYAKEIIGDPPGFMALEPASLEAEKIGCPL